MPVRTFSLEEWFTYYQLKQLNHRHFHVPMVIEADLSDVYQAYAGRAFPLSFILVKALALTLKHKPELNRHLVYTPWGAPRIREAHTFSINMPVMLNTEQGNYLSLVVIKDAHSKSVAQIKDDVKAFYKSRPEELPIGRFIVGKKNTLFNRTRLKLIHWAANHTPSLYDKYDVGTASVSSLLNLEHEGTQVCTMARGPGGLSITASHFNKETGMIKLGCAWDHHISTGLDGVDAAMLLCRVLQGEIEPEALL